MTQPSYNLTSDTARVIQFLLAQEKSGIAFCNSRRSVRDLTGLLKSNRVAAFYGGISPERRAEVVQQLQSGTIKWIIATEALEAGIDLPELECCVLRGWPGSKMAYQQRSGRAGRVKPGMTVLLPNALNPIDRYITEHLELLISGEAEDVFFNDEYPIFVAKHLLCAAAETGIPTSKIKHYFGSAAIEVAKLLMAQGHLNKGRKGLWARGYPHKDVNFRGGVSQTTVKLVDAESGEALEEVSEDIAHREVHPHAIYKRQDGDGQMLTYQCISLDLTTKQAILKQVPESPLFTAAFTQSETSSLKALTNPVALPLKFPSVEGGADLPAFLTLELSYGQVGHITSGYSLMTQLYEQTCLNRRCLNYKEPLPDDSRSERLRQRHCLLCSKSTRKALLIKTLSEESFEQPYRTQFSAPIVKVAIDSTAQDYLQTFAREARTSLSRSGQPIPPGYQQLWEYPSSLIAIHSFGHQILRSLQLFARVDPREVNFSVVKEAGDRNHYAGYFYDTSDGGNGASEAVFKHMAELASTAAAIARGCDCDAGCAKCLIQHGCPDGNTALLKQLGLVLLDAFAEPLVERNALPTAQAETAH